MKHSDRFLGFAWIAVTYSIPGPFPPIDVILEVHTKIYGRPLLGYWKFYEQEIAPSLIEKNVSGRQIVFIPLGNEAAQSLNLSFPCSIRMTQIAG